MEPILIIIITIIVTYILTTVWHNRSTKTVNKNILSIINGLISEMDEMAIELGEQDFSDYLSRKRGQDFSYNATLNIINTIKYLKLSSK